MAKKRSQKKAKKAKKSKKAAARKRALKTTGLLRVVKVKYQCKSGICTAKEHQAHMAKREVVMLEALNTDVTINFHTPPGSPFESGTNPIYIPKGDFQLERVKATALGPHPYALTCSTCPTPGGPPEMIVP